MADGLTPAEQLERIDGGVAALVASQQARWLELRRELAAAGIAIVDVADLSRRNWSGCRTISCCTFSRC